MKVVRCKASPALWHVGRCTCQELQEPLKATETAEMPETRLQQVLQEQNGDSCGCCGGSCE